MDGRKRASKVPDASFFPFLSQHFTVHKAVCRSDHQLNFILIIDDKLVDYTFCLPGEQISDLSISLEEESSLGYI